MMRSNVDLPAPLSPACRSSAIVEAKRDVAQDLFVGWDNASHAVHGADDEGVGGHSGVILSESSGWIGRIQYANTNVIPPTSIVEFSSKVAIAIALFQTVLSALIAAVQVCVLLLKDHLWMVWKDDTGEEVSQHFLLLSLDVDVIHRKSLCCFSHIHALILC